MDAEEVCKKIQDYFYSHDGVSSQEEMMENFRSLPDRIDEICNGAGISRVDMLGFIATLLSTMGGNPS